MDSLSGPDNLLLAYDPDLVGLGWLEAGWEQPGEDTGILGGGADSPDRHYEDFTANLAKLSATLGALLREARQDSGPSTADPGAAGIAGLIVPRDIPGRAPSREPGPLVSRSPGGTPDRAQASPAGSPRPCPCGILSAVMAIEIPSEEDSDGDGDVYDDGGEGRQRDGGELPSRGAVGGLSARAELSLADHRVRAEAVIGRSGGAAGGREDNLREEAGWFPLDDEEGMCPVFGGSEPVAGPGGGVGGPAAGEPYTGPPACSCAAGDGDDEDLPGLSAFIVPTQ